MELIAGIAVSIVTQWVKQYGSSKFHTMFALVLLSLVTSVVYTALMATGYWQTVYGILVTAGAFYAFILQHFEQGTTE